MQSYMYSVAEEEWASPYYNGIYLYLDNTM